MTNSRAKGQRGERSCRDLINRLTGGECYRSVQYHGAAGNADLSNTGQLHCEVKNTERLSVYPAIQQAKEDCPPDKVPTVWHKRNHKPWLLILEAEDIPRFVEAWASLTGKPIYPKERTDDTDCS